MFGGGRWAGSMSVFLATTKSNVQFSVHTKHLVDDMRLWIDGMVWRQSVRRSSNETLLVSTKQLLL